MDRAPGDHEQWVVAVDRTQVGVGQDCVRGVWAPKLVVAHDVRSAVLCHAAPMIRLRVFDKQALLDGSPDELRALASHLERSDDPFAVRCDDGATASVRRQLTESARLRVSIEPGPELLVSGHKAAIALVIDDLRGLAVEADSLSPTLIRRHAHIEYLGELDKWRAADSFPLVVTSDWPDHAEVIPV